MGYANPADRAAQMRRFHARRRTQGRCLECGQPAVGGVRCERHLIAQRLRARAWARRQHGHAPRYEDALGYTDGHPFQFDGPKEQAYYEHLQGRFYRVLVDWRDPLTALLRLEALGYNVFHSPYRIFAA